MEAIVRTDKMVIRLLLLSILISSLILTKPQIAHCNENDGISLKVLTINLLFSEVIYRETRLGIIADFVKAEKEAREPVDIILLQEVVGGSLSGTMNSALDLKKKLAFRGLEYDLSYRLANGLPGLLTVGNAILSRYKILWTISKTLPFVTEEPFDGFEIPLRRKVMMSRIKIPGFGKINVYNTHLCAFCDPEERFEQTEVLLDFIETVEKFIWGKNPIILGGDFNIDLNIAENLETYKLITGKNFVDTYATIHDCCTNTDNDCINCCCEEDNYDGCTFTVPGNPYAINPFTREPELPQRIDYLFRKGKRIETWESTIIFNSDDTDPTWVSDHSGVLTKIGLD